MENEVDKDWYPGDSATERLLYGNINAKIDAYATKYPVLSPDYLTEIHAMCNTFIEGYDKVEQNRATAKQMTNWFTNIVQSKQKDQPIPSAPNFLKFNIPSDATLGLERQCRAFARLMKSQSNYERADGLDLMIERPETDAPDLSNAAPELKLSVAMNTVKTEWKKAGFDALELQYRKADGEQMWQLADKSTEKIIEFDPPLTAPGAPEKFEFRAVYILKNQRVGQWSAIYLVTVG